MMKFFHSDMPGAPVLNGVAGALVDVLDACLVNGFGSKSVSALTISGGVATMTVTAPHAFVVGAKALVAGATVTGGSVNGDQVVTAITNTTISFATALANQTASGTITVKVSGLGWTIAHTGTNKRAYKPSAPEASGFLLRLDDTGTTTARVVGYESMSGIDTGVQPFPTATQMSGGLHWSKSNAADATARPWAVFGDDQVFYLCVNNYIAGSPTFNSQSFGDLIPNKSGDAFACLITGHTFNPNSSSTVAPDGCVGLSNASVATARSIARNYTGVGGAQPCIVIGANHHKNVNANAYAGGPNYGFGSFPNAADNSLLLGRALCVVGNSYRGELAGVLHVVQDAWSAFTTPFQIVDGSGPMAGRKVMTIPLGPVASSVTGLMTFDITGPWR